MKEIKLVYKRSFKITQDTEKINKDGFFISKKLLTKEHRRTCPVCDSFSFSIQDDVYMTKFDCCKGCYFQWVEGREERWETGWRPIKEDK